MRKLFLILFLLTSLVFANKTIVIPPITNAGDRFLGELIILKKDNKKGVINNNKKVIIPFEYDEIYFAHNTSAFDENNNKINYFKAPKTQLKNFKSKYKILGSENHIGVINKKGEIIIPQIYRHIVFDETNKNRFVVFKNDDFALIDINNNFIIPFKKYDEVIDSARYSKCEKFVVCKENKCGIIDINNNLILPMKYDLKDYSDFFE